MAVDRGGLQYTIRIEDNFTGPLDSFVNGIKRARNALNELGRAQTKRVAASKQISSSLREERQEQELSIALSQRRRRHLSIEQRARRQLARQIRKGLTDEAASRIEKEKSLRVQGRLISADEAFIRAQKRLAKIRNQSLIQAKIESQVKSENIKLSFEERRALGLVTKEQNALNAAKSKLAAELRTQRSRELRDLNAQAEALRRINRAEKERQVQQILAAQGRAPTGGIIPPEAPATPAKQKQTLKDRIELFRRLNNTLRRTNNQANRISFTFRRLFGILAAFAAARLIIRGFRQMISEMIRFNASIEQAELGVATLFLAVGDVRDATGAATTAAHGLALAQKEARRQIQLLRRDALKTAATFETLLETFQIGIAPGLQAGLDVDQIREFTVQISRAAAAIGLQQNQLAEEIRSILAGTIQARTTRIAVALGITNEDIRNAREAGVLFEFLTDRFSAFTAAGEETLSTFNAIATNLKDAFLQLIGTGSVEFFETLKNAMQDLQGAFVSQDDITGVLRPDPRAVFVVEQFTRGLEKAVNIAKDLAESLSFRDLANTAQGLGAGLILVARVLQGIIQGFVEGISVVVGVVRSIVGFLQRISGIKLIDNSALTETVALITTLAVIFASIQLATGVVNLLVVGLQIAWAGIAAILTVINGLLVTTSILLGIIAAETAPLQLLTFVIVAALVVAVSMMVAFTVAVKKLTERMLGFNLKWITFFKLVKTALPAAFKLAVAKIKNALLQVQNFVATILVSVVSTLLSTVTEKLADILDFLGKFSDTAAQVSKEVRALGSAIEDVAEEKLADLEDQSKASREELAQLKEEIAFSLKDILAGASEDPTLGEAARGVGERIKNTIADAFGGLKDTLKGELDDITSDIDVGGFEAATVEARSLSEVLDEIPGLLLRQQQPLQANVELIKKLKEELFEARDALLETQATGGLSGDALQGVRRQVEAETRFRKENLKLQEQENSLLQTKQSIQGQLRRNEEEIATLSQEQQKVVRNAVFLADIRFQQERKLEGLKSEAAIEEAKARRAAQQGFADEEQAARQRQQAAEKQIKLLEEELAAQRFVFDEIIDSANLEEEAREKVLRAIENDLLLRGRLVALSENLKQIDEDRLELQSRIAQIAAVQLSADATQTIDNARQERISSRIKLLEQEISFLSEGVVSATERLAIADRELDIQRAKSKLLALQQQADQQAINNVLRKLKSQRDEAIALREEADSKERIEELDQRIAEINDAIALKTQQRAVLYEQNAAAARLEANALEDAQEKAEENRKKLEQPLRFGLISALEEAEEEASDFYTRFFNITKDAMESLATIISDTLVDAFDPSQDTNLRERFRSFLNGLAKEIIAMFVRVAIIKSALGLGNLFGGSTGGSTGGIGDFFSGGGNFQGGRIKKVKAYALDANKLFAGAKGFTDGGPTSDSISSGSAEKNITNLVASSVRPKLDPRDKIPIFAAPNEWVIRAKAVKKYGNDVMNAINEGLVDPTSLRAIAAITDRGVTRKVANSGPGFNVGGSVTTTSGADLSSLASQTGNSGPAVATILADDHLIQQILKGGRSGMLDWMRANNSEIQGHRAERRL